MEIIRTRADMQQRAGGAASGCRTALVPTMGNLHAGHVSLIRRAKREADRVIVSLFVNPTQFGPGEDLERYPRTFEADEATCRSEGVDLLFAPDAAAMYAADHSTHVVEGDLSARHCGAARPGHFRGVCTVVARLFNLTRPAVAVFGEKDFQQLRVIERMTRDLAFPVRIVSGPIVRESDGLAMSSRNRYLSRPHRRQARQLYQALQAAQRAFGDGEQDAERLRTTMAAVLGEAEDAQIEYIEIVDDRNLAPVARANPSARALLAVRLGNTRVIDNAALGSDPGAQPSR